MKTQHYLFLTLLTGSCSLLFLGLDRCGDGIVSEPSQEQCDDGNKESGDGCSDQCQNEAVCGNGVIEAGETCDDSNTAAGDGCDAVCQVEPVCGNGLVEAGEQCEDGNNTTNDACINCQNATCGDGFVQVGVETCDDNNVNCVDCQLQCQSPAECADNDACTTGEDCVNGGCVNVAVDPNDNDPCTSDSCDPVNGVSNTTQGDGFVCNATPQSICLAGNCAASVCGDGFTDATLGEQCDDGNNSDTDACPDQNGTCQNAFCGDGFVLAGVEQCDDGGTTPGDGCDALCNVEGNVVDCAVDPNALQLALQSSLTGASLAVINGQSCTFNAAISLTTQLTVTASGAAAVIDRDITLNSASNLSFTNIRFTAKLVLNDSSRVLIRDSAFSGNNSGLLTLNNSSTAAIVNTIFTNANTGASSQAIFCGSGNAKLVADRITVTGCQGDETIRLNNGCQGAIANSLFINNPNVLSTLSIEGGSIMGVAFSTFFTNASENGIAIVGGGGAVFRIQSSVGQAVGNQPISTQGAGNITAETSFIQGDNRTGVTNINPQLDANFHITNAQVLGNANQNPSGAVFSFDPLTVLPGVNLFDHDFSNNPRPQAARDPGAFEEP